MVVRRWRDPIAILAIGTDVLFRSWPRRCRRAHSHPSVRNVRPLGDRASMVGLGSCPEHIPSPWEHHRFKRWFALGGKASTSAPLVGCAGPTGAESGHPTITDLRDNAGNTVPPTSGGSVGAVALRGQRLGGDDDTRLGQRQRVVGSQARTHRRRVWRVCREPARCGDAVAQVRNAVVTLQSRARHRRIGYWQQGARDRETPAERHRFRSAALRQERADRTRAAGCRRDALSGAVADSGW